MLHSTLRVSEYRCQRGGRHVLLPVPMLQRWYQQGKQGRGTPAPSAVLRGHKGGGAAGEEEDEAEETWAEAVNR